MKNLPITGIYMYVNLLLNVMLFPGYILTFLHQETYLLQNINKSGIAFRCVVTVDHIRKMRFIFIFVIITSLCLK